LYHVLAYGILFWVKFLSSSANGVPYLDWTNAAVALTLAPALATQIAVLVQPKRLDSRTKELYEAMLFRRSNQSAELASLSQKYLAEKKAHQALLEQMLPPHVVQELQDSGTVLSEHFENCSVFFSDIEQYTTITANSRPQQVVDMLNRLYTLFDSILELDSRLWKVETVGDGE